MVHGSVQISTPLEGACTELNSMNSSDQFNMNRNEPFEPTPGCESDDTTATLKSLNNSGTEQLARKLALVLYNTAGITYDRLLKRSGMAEPAFGTALNYGREQDWFLKDENQEYHLNLKNQLWRPLEQLREMAAMCRPTPGVEDHLKGMVNDQPSNEETAKPK